MTKFLWKFIFFLTGKQKSRLSGKIIVFEGIDGSGKETQFRLFIALLQRLRVPYQTFDFPQYQKTLGGKAVKMALRGELGSDPSHLPVKALSLFYSIDRAEVAPKIKKAQQKGCVVALNRYITSNKGHQAWKLPTKEAQEEYLRWLEYVEHQLFEIPKEDIVIFFNLSLNNAIRLIKQRKRPKDKVEIDRKYLENSLLMYRQLAQRYPHWITLECEDKEGNLLPPEKIHTKVLAALAAYLGR